MIQHQKSSRMQSGKLAQASSFDHAFLGKDVGHFERYMPIPMEHAPNFPCVFCDDRFVLFAGDAVASLTNVGCLAQVVFQPIQFVKLAAVLRAPLKATAPLEDWESRFFFIDPLINAQEVSRYGEIGDGKHRHRNIFVPCRIQTHFVVVQTYLVFRFFEGRFYIPTRTRNAYKLFNRRSSWCKNYEIGKVFGIFHASANHQCAIVSRTRRRQWSVGPIIKPRTFAALASA